VFDGVGRDAGIRFAAACHRNGMVLIQPALLEQLHGPHTGRGWVYVVVDDPDAHYAHANQAGADMPGEPHDALDGRQRGYSARTQGHLWSFGTPGRRRSDTQAAAGSATQVHMTGRPDAACCRPWRSVEPSIVVSRRCTRRL
jgi:hypothetical protein